MEFRSAIDTTLRSAATLQSAIANDAKIIGNIEAIITKLVDTYKAGNKVLFCGNGGSAADAQHLAAELSGKFYIDRPPLAAEALHVNTSFITAVGNDYSFEEIYARNLSALGKKGDVLFAMTTSGNSMNIIKALQRAKEIDISTVVFTGQNNGNVDQFADLLIKIPSTDTPRIQEGHLLIGHIICEQVEKALFS